MNQAPRLQCLANGTNSAVHHVAGGDHVDPGLGLRQRLLHQYGGGFVVQDIPRFVQQAVLAVAGEGVQGHIGHHTQLGKAFFQFAHHLGHKAIGVHGFSSGGVFQRGINHREQGHHRNAQLDAVFGHRQKKVQAQAFDTRHGANGLALVLAVQHENRINQVVRCDLVLAHQVAGEFVTAQAAWAAGGEGGNRVHGENCA